MNKILDYIGKYLSKMPSLPVTAMWAIYLYAAFLFISVLIYLIMILYQWYATDKPPISDMRDFCETALSSAAVTAVSFCARYFVDKNHDGVPDAVDAENEKQRRNF